MNEQKPVSKPAPIRAVAGPEMDAAIAEHVMGLRRVEGQHVPQFTTKPKPSVKELVRERLSRIEVDDDPIVISKWADTDPRDLPIRNNSALIQWALCNCSWKGEERALLSALAIADGDVESVCRSINVDIGLCSLLLAKVRALVLFCARSRDWEESFTSTRISGVDHPGRPPRIPASSTWFLERVHTRDAYGAICSRGDVFYS